ncbi:hypothetical protein ACWCPM_23975 [Streptomyces sp. NPDC002309]
MTATPSVRPRRPPLAGDHGGFQFLNDVVELIEGALQIMVCGDVNLDEP